MLRRCWAVIAFLCVLLPQPRAAEACGGFFCGRQPVDQTAERIVFKVNEDSVTMITQISYTGAAADFAWVLPLAEVPDVESLDVFPQLALTGLDSNTGPRFQFPQSCFQNLMGGFALQSNALDPSASNGVTVHFRADVGPYDVVAIESKDPMALYKWLRENGFNVTEVMLPYIRSYTAERMKFLALKLQQDKNTNDIQPFRFDLPGTTPSIPLRMTALAAEPEMGVLVFIFGDQRWNGANWPEIEIDDSQILWGVFASPTRASVVTNWQALVARGIDEAGGRGWVTDLASSTTSLKDALATSITTTPEIGEATQQLMELIGDSSYVSRLYARLSPEEMTSDPIFHRVSAGDVSNSHMLSDTVNGERNCFSSEPPDPCLFTSCGAGGICRPVLLPGSTQPVAGCGCLPGATARTTFDPSSAGLRGTPSEPPMAIVICQDARMSFVNPGDMMSNGAKMSDPCVDFDCGENGSCVAMNMTPTCTCDAGFVAVGSIGVDGRRRTACHKPMIEVPMEFYAQRLPDLPAALPGRGLRVRTNLPVIQPRMSDLGSTSGALPEKTSEPPADDGCGVAAAGGRSGAAGGLALAMAWLLLVNASRSARSRHRTVASRRTRSDS